MVFLKMHSKSNVFYTLSAFYISLIKHLLVSFLLPTLPPEEKPASKHPTLRPAFSPPLLLSYPPGALPWCLPQAGCRGPYGPPHRAPCAAAAAREVHPVLPGWLGHWHSHSGHDTPGPASWAEPPPVALWGGGEGIRGQALSHPSCHQASVWALHPTGMLSLSTPLLPCHPLGEPRTLACTKERVKAWVLPLHKCSLSTDYVLCTAEGTEKDLLPWRNSPVKFLNLSKGRSHSWSKIKVMVTATASIFKCWVPCMGKVL